MEVNLAFATSFVTVELSVMAIFCLKCCLGRCYPLPDDMEVAVLVSDCREKSNSFSSFDK